MADGPTSSVSLVVARAGRVSRLRGPHWMNARLSGIRTTTWIMTAPVTCIVTNRNNSQVSTKAISATFLSNAQRKTWRT
eukprot:4755330-Amphidinium_carterae.1